MEVPSCQVSIRRPSAAGDHSPALSVQITHEEKRKIDNRAPPSRVLEAAEKVHHENDDGE
jgi:hypothetical protein